MLLDLSELSTSKWYLEKWQKCPALTKQTGGGLGTTEKIAVAEMKNCGLQTTIDGEKILTLAHLLVIGHRNLLQNLEDFFVLLRRKEAARRAGHPNDDMFCNQKNVRSRKECRLQ
jgi:hypothetical protein